VFAGVLIGVCVFVVVLTGVCVFVGVLIGVCVFVGVLIGVNACIMSQVRDWVAFGRLPIFANEHISSV